MNKEDVYKSWRPENSPWSQWVKPVVFAFLPEGDLDSDGYSVPHWQVPLHPDTAVIADVPGPDGILAGIALAHAGYLPVLMYNACPTGMYQDASLFPTRNSQFVVVDMSSILTSICATTKELESLSLPAQSPPVFLLDRNRRAVGRAYGPGWFDNRSFVSPTDFPSADYFHRHGISKIILLQPSQDIEPDLTPVLLRLQRDGMTIASQTPFGQWKPALVNIKPPMFLISAWEWFRQKIAYPRSSSFQASFGAFRPPSSS